MTKLDGELEREIVVHGIGPVIVKLTADGLTFRVKGSRMELNQNWVQIVGACNTPANVKCFVANKPYEALKHAATQKSIKTLRKLQTDHLPEGSY